MNEDEVNSPLLDIQWLKCGDGKIEFELSKLLEQTADQHIILYKFANALLSLSKILANNSNNYEDVVNESKNVHSTKIYKFYCDKVDCIISTMQITMAELK
jgi:chaperonin GroEL (HSP60 family)